MTAPRKLLTSASVSFVARADGGIGGVAARHPGDCTLRLPLHRVEHGREAGPLRTLTVELRDRCEVQPRDDLRRQLAAGQNAKLCLIVRLGVRHVFGARRRIESCDRRGALVLDEHARRRAIHRRRRERAHGHAEHHEQEHRDDDVSVFVDGVEAIEHG